MSETSRIKLDPLVASLNLVRFDKSLSFGEILDSLNRNFDEIIGNFGGPMGQPGPIGPPGCKGEAGPQGEAGESDLNWKSLQSVRCDSAAYNNENGQDNIANRLTNRGVLLSNLALDDAGNFRSTNWQDATLSSEKVSNYFSRYKLKIYNAGVGGYGEHIHLMNTKAIEGDYRFLCESGFTISNDFIAAGINKETLRIVGRKNSTRLTCLDCGSTANPNTVPLPNHVTDVEIISDLLSLKNTFTSQTWKFDTGSTLDNIYSMRFVLDIQTKDNIESVPDRDGYVAVWETTLDHSETWEYVTASSGDLIIHKAKYLDSNYATSAVDRDGTQWVLLDPSSWVRFKRQNNWMLIDFHINIIRNTDFDSFTLRNIEFLLDTPLVGASTAGWHPSTAMENESIDEDNTDVSCYGHFQVVPVKLASGANSFKIANKFPYNIYNLVFDSTDPQGAVNYYLTGQVWATIATPAECEIVTITPCVICPPSIIVVNP